MAFFGIPAGTARGVRAAPQRSGKVSIEFLRKHECAACPLNNLRGLAHPHMEPTGAAKPLVYFLGDAPGGDDDRKGEQFSGAAGRLLRRRLPARWLPKVRFNNVVRTKTPKGRAPVWEEVESCFPAGTLVRPIGRIKTLYRRWYEGSIFVVVTKRGHRLSGTPNHPVFTPHGKVSIHSLREGDNVFCASGADTLSIAGNPNVNNEPTPIDEIFRSFGEPTERKRMRSALDFHGDGAINSEVDIIRTDCELLNDRQVGLKLQQQILQKRFPAPYFDFASLMPFCSAPSGETILPMIASGDSFGSGMCLVPSSIGCAYASYFNSMVAQVGAQPVSIDPLVGSDAFGAFPSFISTNDIAAWVPCFVRKFFRPAGSHILRFCSEFNSLFEEIFSDCRVVGAGETTECGQTSPVDVEVDEVVSVETIGRFAGHVYNLETSTGQYIAENVLVSNCRPSIERDVAASAPMAIVGFGNAPLSWAGVADSGIGLWCGRRVPVMVGGKPYWFFPVQHPESIQRDPKWRGAQQSPGRYGSEGEFQFALHLRAALDAVEAGLPEPAVHSADDALAGVEWVTGAGGADDVARVRQHLRRAAHRKVAGVDYETNALRPYADAAKILTAAVSTVDGALAFPLDHREAKWSKAQRAEVDELWHEFLYAAECRKVAHHLAFEMEWSAHFYGKECLRAGRWGDSVAQAYILDERAGAHNLEFLCIQYFGVNIKKLAGVNRADLDAEALDKVLRYNGLDAKYHRLLYAEQSRALREAKLSRLYAEHLERVPTAVLTQLKGIPINQAAVLRLGRKYVPRMIEAEREMRALPAVRKFERAKNKKFRPSANEDVKAALHGIGIHLDNVDEEALDGVDHELALEEVKWRKAAKIYGTYVTPVADDETRAKLDGLRRAGLEEIGGSLELKEARACRVSPDGLIHPQLNVSRVRTSRTSADDINYQNYPKRGAADAIEVRGMIEPLEPDELVVSFDYGQIQARNVGMESLDPALLKAFWDDYDIHHDFMEHLARLWPAWVKEGAGKLAQDPKLAKKYRNDVKHGFVFASFFGAGANKTSGVLGVPLRIGEKLGEIFWDRFGGIKKWHGKLERDYYKTGYVTGHAGYRRRAPVSYNERINSPIQAAEAKIVLDAMTRLSKIDHDYLQANMEIHDDLTFIWPKKKVDELAEIVIREMLTTTFEWAKATPIVVEMSVGRSWANQKEVGVFSSNKYDGIDMPRECPL